MRGLLGRARSCRRTAPDQTCRRSALRDRIGAVAASTWSRRSCSSESATARCRWSATCSIRAIASPRRSALRASDLHARCLAALRDPIPPVIAGQGPAQEVVHHAGIDLAQLLPVPTWFEREGGPYITAGVIVAKDPETGRRNVSIARLRLEGGARLMAGHCAQPSSLPSGREGKGAGPPARDRGGDRQSRRRAARLADVRRSWR